MEYHPVVKIITDWLQAESVWFETFTHEPVRTSAEASQVRTGYTIDQGAKALIIRVKHPVRGKHFVMVVVPGSQRFDVMKLKTLYGFTDIRFATEAEVSEITGGVLPGGVPPLGSLFNLPVYVEEALLKNEKIIFNAGDRRFSVGMRCEDYVTLVQPRIGSIA